MLRVGPILATLVACANVVPCAFAVERLAAAPNASGREAAFDRDDWPWWRGPERNGAAAAEQSPPLHWSDTENIVWKTPVPGRGHGSPTLVGDQIFLATADEARQTQSVLCYDRPTGKLRWKTDVHRAGVEVKGNQKSSLASGSVACDGERLYINFLNADAVYTTALDREGKQLWQTKVSDFVVHQGYGASPAVYGPLVLVTADHKGGGAIAALERTTGKIAWRHDRPSEANYTSPIVLHAAGRDQLLVTGCNLVSGFDPLTGTKLWEIEGATTECVTSTVTDGQRIFTSGGYPRNHVAAIEADGSGQVAWENNARVYVPSMLTRDGYLYAVADAGVAMCWKTDTGDERWKGRLRGTFSASPVLVGDRIYAVNETGEWFVFQADPQRFQLLAENSLTGQFFATPVICGGRIYQRLAQEEGGQRQELLYCIGEAADRTK